MRSFDFWLGTWEVHSREGNFLGRNRVEALFGGTIVQEHWEGASGARGTSLTAYMPDRGSWRQTWVDSEGHFLDLEGGILEGCMVLQGMSWAKQGPMCERIIWTPMEDGRVLQVWDQSYDGGTTWIVAFEGFYSRAK